MKKILILSVMVMIIIMPLPGAVNITRSSKNNTNASDKIVSNEEFTHMVLAEYGTLTTCPHCPAASSQLYDIYNYEDYDFIYVSLVYNMNKEETGKRLQELGITSVPDVYFDGKYTHVLGEQDDDQPYRTKIATCGSRDVADIDVDVNVVWQGNAILKITVTVTVQNNEPEDYNGHLRVYIVEPESRWNDADGNQYHFGVLDIPVDRNLAVQQNLAKRSRSLHPLSDTYEFSRTWFGSLHGFEDITQDNIMVIAAVFDKDTDYVVQTASAEPAGILSDDKSITSNGYINITVHNAYDMLTSTENGVQIPIDVRTDDEWNEERIDTPSPENPRHYCLADLQDENGLQEFMSLYEGKEIIIYCRTGGRSSTAAQILVDNEFTGTIYNMLGGITAWKDAGYPTPKARSHSLLSLVPCPVFLKFLEKFPHSFPILRHLLGL